MYDILYASRDKILEQDWINFKSRFPRAIRCDDVETFDDLKSKSFTKFFWIVWDDLEIVDDFKFEYVIPEWDKSYTHLFLNNDEYNGVILISKDVEVSKKEIEFRFFMNFKPIEIIASCFKKYDIICIGNVDKTITNKFSYSKVLPDTATLEEIKNSSSTKMFWIIWDDVLVNDDFDFSYRAETYSDTKQIHAFKNGDFYDGICLFPKNIEVSLREFSYKFFTNKKEIDILASTPKQYDIFYIDTYEEYLKAAETSTLCMFWIVFNDLQVNSDFKFDYQVPKHDQYITHVFKNGEYYNGICLFPKNKLITKREFDNRFFIDKKEIDIQASTPKPYDIVFISYYENNADRNYKKLLERFPEAKRIDKVKGIHQAHIEAAKLSTTDMFWVVDADAIIEDNFNFNHNVSAYDKKTVHVWRSRNPINGLEYGYGGVKLLPKHLTLNMNVNQPDMTTSISTQFKAIAAVSNTTEFNTDEFSAWRSAFRECVKLASGLILRNNASETLERLNIWCSVGKDKPFGEYALAGAKSGKLYGETHIDDTESISMINDFEWLKQEFKKEFSR
jgi:hypothetical protein